MPGLSGESERQRAHREGILIAEQRSGKKIIESVEDRKKRRQLNGEAMYKQSAAVPESMAVFATEIHREDRITRNEEIELGMKTQEAIKVQDVYDKLRLQYDREPTDEEWCAAAGKINMEAIRQTIDEGLEAKNKLVTSNLRMVQSVVNTYIRNGLTAQYNAGDMMQDGIIALIRAAEKFEPDRGWKFSTYAMYWVRASVKRSQLSQSRIVNVPQRLHENYKRMLKLDKELTVSLGRRPTRSELGKAAGLTQAQVDRCLDAMRQQCFSLDQEITNSKKPMSSNSGRDTMVDIIESKAGDPDLTKMKQVMLREDLIATLERHLEAEEVELLLLRYGLKETETNFTGRQLTIAELSRNVGLKPDKVRRILNRSLRQLKTSVSQEEWLAFERELP